MSAQERDKDGKFLPKSRLNTNGEPTFFVRVDEVSGEGEGVTRSYPRGTLKTQQDVILDFGLDPEEWAITSLERSFWEQSKRLENGDRDTIQLEAIRAKFRAVPKNSPNKIRKDVKELIKVVDSYVPMPAFSYAAPEGKPKASFVVLLADWQLGKSDSADDSTACTEERLGRCLDLALGRFLDMASRYVVEEIFLLGLGDLVEGCTGFYAMQNFTVDLNAREQRKLAWRWAMKYVTAFSQFGIPVRLTGIAGNHGENRLNGKAFTEFEDNDDLLMLDACSDVVAANSYLSGIVTVEHPTDPLCHNIKISGVDVGIVHGHQFGGGANASAKASKWWEHQIFGRTAVQNSKLLFSGHFHHLSILECSEMRTHIQAPAMDGGSRWFKAHSGVSSQAGLFTTMVGEGISPLGFTDSYVCYPWLV